MKSSEISSLQSQSLSPVSPPTVSSAPVSSSLKETSKSTDLWDISAGLVNLDLASDLEKKKQLGVFCCFDFNLLSNHVFLYILCDRKAAATALFTGHFGLTLFFHG